ncbi:MAG: PAC2 family protein [Ignisphaera sp.]|uniref:Proteasome assembly chaperone family protein n=1 Tax=Ignisphaera aggregans TaxID=334771 RepID=A0A7C4D172_9CREN
MWILEKLRNVPQNSNTVAIAGFPGMGFVGKTVAEHIKNYLNAEVIARIYGYGFPAHLISNDKGEADVLNIEISFAEINNLGILVITGEMQPISDQGQHSLGRFIASKLGGFGVRELITAAAFVSEAITHTRRVYVVGNDIETIKKYVDKGAVPLSGGVISGLNGIMVGWARQFNIKAVCLLGETWRSIVEMNYIDYTAAKMIIELLNNVWHLDIDTNELVEKGITIENKVQDIINRYIQRQEQAQDKRPYYIT